MSSLLMKGCRLSSCGVFEFTEDEYIKGGDPEQWVSIYRPEHTLKAPSFIRSLQNIPLINDHSEDGNRGALSRAAGGVLFNARYVDEWLLGDIKVCSQSMIDAIESGKIGLSLGHRARLLYLPGTYKETPYKFVMVDMRAWHVALVEKGRVPGAQVRYEPESSIPHADGGAR